MSNQTITEPQKFAGDIAWVAASYLAIPLVGLITLPALTKNYTVEIYGVWMQATFTVFLLLYVLNLCLGYAEVRFLAAEDDAKRRRNALGAMLWPILTVSCLSVIISLLLKQNLSILLFASPAYAYLIPLIFLWASIEAIFSFFIFYMMARRRIKRLSIIQMVLTALKMLVIITVAAAGYDLSWIIGCTIAGETVITAVIFGMIVREIGWPVPTLTGLRTYLVFSAPLILNLILFWVTSYGNRYFIAHMLRVSQAGIYSASYTIVALMSLFYSPIQVVLFPAISRLWEQKEVSRVRNYMEYSNKLFLTLAIPGAAGLYIVSQPLLGILTTADYMAGAGLVLLISIGAIMLGLYSINVYVILAIRQTKWLLPVIAIAAVANAGLNLFLIPKIGILGAAVSEIVCYFILAAAILVWVWKVLRYKVEIKFLAKVTIGALLMAICITFIHISGIVGIIISAIAGAVIFALWMWLVRAFSSEDRMLIKEIVLGLKQGALFR
jgi:O-antigen/teichoic acid export membrane protein